MIVMRPLVHAGAFFCIRPLAHLKVRRRFWKVWPSVGLQRVALFIYTLRVLFWRTGSPKGSPPFLKMIDY